MPTVDPYVPDFEPQHDQGLRPPYTNCNAASNAMLIDWWTRGAINTSDLPIRQATGVSVSEGLNFAAINKAVKTLWPEQLGELVYSEATGWSPKPLTWAGLLDHLNAGGCAVVCGNYGDLPVHYRRWSPNFTGGHAMLVKGPVDSMKLWDPMAQGDADYAGEPISKVALWEYLWTSSKADANVRVTAAYGFTKPRPALGRFIDVPLDSVHRAAIERAAELKLIQGIGRGRFGFGRDVRREELATIIMRLYDRLTKEDET